MVKQSFDIEKNIIHNQSAPKIGNNDSIVSQVSVSSIHVYPDLRETKKNINFNRTVDEAPVIHK